jgi:Uma2 family endonuclease
MATETPRPPLSYADYAAIDDGRRYQVVDGELIVTPSPNTFHQRALFTLAGRLDSYLQAHPVGEAFFAPFDVILRVEAPAIVVQPDLLFVSAERSAIVTEANIQGAPDLVVEILSPSNARLDTIRKLPLYAAAGVREYWIVHYQFDRIEVLRLDPATGHYGRPELYLASDVLTSPLLPGFELAVAALFPPEEQAT